MRVLVLGGYGLIGVAIARRLHDAGHAVTGMGRSAGAGPRWEPRIRWLRADIATLVTAGAWSAHLAGIDVVVNAAGALQDGPRDDLGRIHHTAIGALAAACAQAAVKLVQVSAPGARIDSSTEFMRSKARGDAAIRQSGADWIIVRPGLVLGRDTYGGSALLRTMAAFPVVLPIALGEKRIQVVALTDVARVVQEAVEGGIPSHVDVDLVEDAPHALRDIVVRMRSWLGIRPAAALIAVPSWVATVTAKVADLLGFLGWRPALRTTALRALEDEVLGDPQPLRRLRGTSLRSLDQLLDGMPAGVQERWFARAGLLLPLVVATLAAFWIASGVIGALDVERAARAIPEGALPQGMPVFLVLAGSALDIVLGIAIVIRRFARLAALGMVATSLLYLGAGSLLAPGLWLDPLGAFVKVVPGIVLAVVAAALLEERSRC